MWFHPRHAFEYHTKLVALAWIIFFYETLKFFKIDFFQRKNLKGKIIEFSKKNLCVEIKISKSRVAKVLR
jgi:hypothetical protein